MPYASALDIALSRPEGREGRDEGSRAARLASSLSIGVRLMRDDDRHQDAVFVIIIIDDEVRLQGDGRSRAGS